MKVRVHYPVGSGELRLRVEPAWETSIAPRRVDRARTRFEFELADDAAFRYFKPVLEEDGRTLWSRGDNQLAVRERKGALDVHPHFAEDSSCHVCETHLVPSSFDELGHEVRVFLPAGYEENTLQRFPVLYMQDGQNLFFPEGTPQGKHWRIAETLRVLDSMCLIRPVIVVGIYPQFFARLGELAFTPG